MRRFILGVSALVCMVSRAGAVDFGWQTLSGGGIEYIVQVEPQLIDSFRQEGFTSEVPAGLRDIRRIRIEVGNERLPNQGNLTGPTIAQAAPAKAAVKGADDVAPAAPETFGQTEQKSAGSQVEVSGNSVGGALPLLDSSRPVPPLPFFQSGPAKSLSSNRSEAVQAEPRAAKPDLKAEEAVPVAASESNESGRRTVEAGMATAPGSAGESDAAANHASSTGPTKPWGVLLLAILGLFASLGANAYLVWIHQEVRTKYRTLAGQMHGGAAM